MANPLPLLVDIRFVRLLENGELAIYSWAWRTLPGARSGMKTHYFSMAASSTFPTSLFQS